MTGTAPVRFTQEYLVRSPREQEVLTVPEDDWRRIKRIVQGTVPRNRWFRDAAGIMAGISVTAWFSVVGLSAMSMVPAWMQPTYLAVAIAAAALSGALFLLDGEHVRITESSANDVLLEMSDVEGRLEQAAPLEPAGGDLGRGAIPSRGDDGFAQGDRVTHETLGEGRVVAVQRGRRTEKLIAVVDFGPRGRKAILEPGRWLKRR